MAYYIALFVFILICLLLSVVVLLQQSKGGGLAGAFGGAGAGEAMFGARGVTTFLHKATIWLGVLFMAMSLLLVYFSAQGTGSSVARRAAERVPVSTGATPITIPTTDATVPTPVGDAVVPPAPVPVPVEGGDATGGDATGGSGDTGDEGGEGGGQ